MYTTKNFHLLYDDIAMARKVNKYAYKKGE